MTQYERERLLKHSTNNIEAYEAYMKGREYLPKATIPDGHKAVESFEKAITLDSNYAPAYAALCDALLVACDNYLPPHEALPRAREYAEKAIASDPLLDEANLVVAQIKLWADWDSQGAEAEFKRTLELNRNYANAHRDYARFLTNLSRFPEATGEMQIALDLEPNSARLRFEMAWIDYCARKYERAKYWLQEALSLDPNSSTAHRRLGLVLAQQGEIEQAIEEIKTGSPNSKRGRIRIGPGLDLRQTARRQAGE
jgi:tetratricopeptide (TPR) repeat protein